MANEALRNDIARLRERVEEIKAQFDYNIETSLRQRLYEVITGSKWNRDSIDGDDLQKQRIAMHRGELGISIQFLEKSVCDIASALKYIDLYLQPEDAE